ncbi:MAG: sugar-binding transcriptional regulator [Anaerolineae bacterium]|nr:sugar-binding transcriptional regulator [Anaerolineae bacterium]
MGDVDYDEQILQAAHLYYVDNLTQAEIAKVLGVSRPTVSRLLTRAREEGIVQVTITPWRQRDAALEEQVSRRFNLRGAIIVRTSSGSNPAAVRQGIGFGAGSHVVKLIRPEDVIGIGRGRTLAELTAAMHPPGEPMNLTIVQLLGDVSAQHDESLARELTRQLAANFGGQAYYVTAPALVDNAATRDMLMKSAAITAATQLYSRLQIALVGIGEIEKSPLVLGGLISEEEAAQLRRQGIVGDICGYFFDIDGQFRSTTFDGRAIGITLDELQRCDNVVAVAGGDDKVVPLLGVLRSGIVDFLVSDQLTTANIMQLVQIVESK